MEEIMRANPNQKAALLALIALLLAGCSLSPLKGNPGTSSNSGGKSPATATAFSPSTDARKDVVDALRKLKTAYPYRLTETMSATANGQMAMPESTRVVEFAAADRSHMKWTGGQGGDVEAISIGEKHYWFENGKWTEGTIPSSKGADRGADFASRLAEMVKEVKYVGPENLNGLPCFVYTCTFETTLSGQTYAGTSKVWIGADDGLLHQSDSEFKVSTYANKSHMVYEYNPSFKVEPPAM
jgi:hypothetical protein